MGHGTSGVPSPTEHAAKLTEALSLTPEQVRQVEAIFTESQPRADAVYRDTALSDTERAERLAEIRGDNEAKIRALLSPDQQERFTAHLERLRAECEAVTA